MRYTRTRLTVRWKQIEKPDPRNTRGAGTRKFKPISKALPPVGVVAWEGQEQPVAFPFLADDVYSIGVLEFFISRMPLLRMR